LKARGYTWEFRTGVPLKAFNAEVSLGNQARVGKPLDPSTVDRYVTALSNGDVFPAILAAETPSVNGLLVVDGNHRFAAFQGGERKSIDAYVITGASPAAITLETFEANTRHGLPTSETDRIHQAMYMVDSGLSAEESARRLALKVNVLRSHLALKAAAARATESGITVQQWDRLATAVKTRLNQISTDEGFLEAVRLTIDAGLTGPEVSDMARNLSSLRSSKKQTDYVRALRHTMSERLQTGGKLERPAVGRQVRSGRTAFGMVLGQIGALPGPVSIVSNMVDTEKHEWARRTEVAIDQLQAVLDELKG
jgi:hypothetical protein